MISIYSALFMSFVLGIGWFLTMMLKNKQIAFEKNLADIRVNEIRTDFEMYRNVSDSEINSLNERLKIEIARTAEFQQLAQKLLFYKRDFSIPIILPDTIQAVKYAMKHAHPDNGGNAEDFMKFKKCYEELTKQEE